MTTPFFRSGVVSMAVSTLALLSSVAHAGLIVEGGQLPVVVATPSGLGTLPAYVAPSLSLQAAPTVEHIGAIGANAKRISVRVVKKPISNVLAMLVPQGWSGYASDSRIKSITEVSFVGDNRPWPVVLEEVLETHGLVGRIDWDKRELSVAVSPQGVR